MSTDNNEILTAEQAASEWDRQIADKEAGVNPLAEPTAVSDPWEAVPQVVRERLQQFDSVVHELKTTSGRVAALQRELDVAKQAAKQSSNAPTQSQINAASGSGEKWKALKEEYAEWTDAIEERLSGFSVGGIQANDPNLLEKLEALSMLVKNNAEQSNEISKLKVSIRHPNWENVVVSPEFDAWRKVQPPDVSALFTSDRPDDAVRMLDLYAATAKADKVAAQRQTRLQGSVNPETGRSGQAPRKSPDDMTDEEIWDQMAKERAAKKQQYR